MRNLRVNIPNYEYDIKIEKGLISRVGEMVREITNARLVAVITDSNVAPLYLGGVVASLKDAGFEIVTIEVPFGERSKSPDMLKFLYERLLKSEITRSDLIVALGGGVVGDLVGYCAATLLRGIPFVQIPTTLLAQVDSSVGGKVAINLPQGKNLVGAFYQPKLVIIDPNCLETLDDRTFCDGMAEVIKYGAIANKDLFDKLDLAAGKEGVMDCIEDVVYTCCDLKRMIVEKDEHDTGERMILNFGHTFGHAIEKEYNFEKYTHGEAVAIGMVMASEMGEKIGVTKVGTAKEICRLLNHYNLPQSVKLDKEALRAAVSVDKKGDGKIVNLVLLTEIGEAVIRKTDKKDI